MSPRSRHWWGVVALMALVPFFMGASCGSCPKDRKARIFTTNDGGIRSCQEICKDRDDWDTRTLSCTSTALDGGVIQTDCVGDWNCPG